MNLEEKIFSDINKGFTLKCNDPFHKLIITNMTFEEFWQEIDGKSLDLVSCVNSLKIAKIPLKLPDKLPQATTMMKNFWEWPKMTNQQIRNAAMHKWGNDCEISKLNFLLNLLLLLLVKFQDSLTISQLGTIIKKLEHT